MTSISESLRSRAILPWTITITVCLLAVCSWGQAIHWNAREITAYSFFPLFGLIGYSVMWSQYLAHSLSRKVFAKTQLSDFLTQNRRIAVIAVALHPALIADIWLSGSHSSASLTATTNTLALILSVASLGVFLMFSLYHRFSQKSWWKYITRAGDAAMVAMFYHGLQLDPQLQSGWYHYVWLFYGVSLVAILLQKYAFVSHPVLTGLQDSKQPAHK